jgi:hypothetical protein
VNRGEEQDRRLDADAVAERSGRQPGEWHCAVVDHLHGGHYPSHDVCGYVTLAPGTADHVAADDGHADQ